jgi:hypothetical protein
MKKCLLISLSVLCLAQFESCTKDKTAMPAASVPAVFKCDSTVTYTKYIAAIFNPNCAYSGCHAVQYPAGGVVLSDYNDCKLQVENNNLIGVVKHEFGYPPMPYPLNSPPLSDSVIAIIQCWKDQGCPR